MRIFALRSCANYYDIWDLRSAYEGVITYSGDKELLRKSTCNVRMVRPNPIRFARSVA